MLTRFNGHPISVSGQVDVVGIIRAGENHFVCDSKLHSDHRESEFILSSGEVDSNHSGLYKCPADKLSLLVPGDIVLLNLREGRCSCLYSKQSTANVFFTTTNCNSSCIMCPQPPNNRVITNYTDVIKEVIELIEEAPESIGISGGEPTLLKDDLVTIIQLTQQKFPQTFLSVLTNARLFAYKDYVLRFDGLRRTYLNFGIPLYAANADMHDFIVGAKGAFDQTVQGILNLAEKNFDIEIRVVLHRLTVPGLSLLVDYIYRNFPFVSHVALMGLEQMGYAKKNLSELWTDPIDYQSELKNVCLACVQRGLNVSVYNLPLCILPKETWGLSVRSISDWKNVYTDVCNDCKEKSRCCGFFSSDLKNLSRGIRPIVQSSVIRI